jgi:hypothetical protein
MRTTLFISMIAALLLTSCDIIEFPYIEKPETGNDTTKVYRKILLEDYSGHRCNNCPTAALEAKTIHDTYGDRVIVMTVHASFLAVPFPGTYSYDFRTPEGTDYAATFGISSVPNGMVNRKEFSGNFALNYSSWAGEVSQLVDEEASIGIEIETNYTSSTRNLQVEVNTEFLESLSGDYKVVVLLLESGIIKPQLNNNPALGLVPDIMDYEHNHVLRTSMNGTWGEAISLNGNDSKTYNLVLNSEWDASKMAVLAYVYRDDDSDGNRYEVMQVEEKEL